MGNLMVGAGAFCFGAQDAAFDWKKLLAFCAGMALVVAGSCVLNNYYDRDIDRRMKRTATRPSATGVLPMSLALPYALFLAIVGFWLLVVFVNWQTAVIGFVGALTYAGVYSYAKRHTHHATLIGTLPGATPPLAGYVAATGRFDLAAWLLFGLLVAWQMPHFYAISLFRREEYARAGVPVLPVARSVERTMTEMRIYGLLFVLSAILFAAFSGASWAVGFSLYAIAGWWLSRLMQRSDESETTVWARRVFKASLLILPLLSVLLTLDRWL